MKSEQRDFFAAKAQDYDKEEARTQNVDNIGQSMLKHVSFTKEMRVMDFGSGTGLLLTQIAPHVAEITAVDISSSMNNVLKSKVAAIGCPLKILEMDLTKEPLETKFDSIISSMTIHHIEDVRALFRKFYALLEPGGVIAIADLDKEDGSFHTEDTGVFHLGFDREEFLGIATDAGFKDLKMYDASVMEKPAGSYPIFLMTGKK